MSCRREPTRRRPCLAMSTKAAPYPGVCAACGAPGASPAFSKRPQGRNLSKTNSADQKAVYPLMSDINNKQCCGCETRLRSQTKAQRAQTTPSQGTITSRKRRLTDNAVAEAAVTLAPTVSGVPAQGTRGFSSRSTPEKKRLVFGARSPRLDLKTDDSVCVREHLILLLMSMVTCG